MSAAKRVGRLAVDTRGQGAASVLPPLLPRGTYHLVSLFRAGSCIVAGKKLGKWIWIIGARRPRCGGLGMRREIRRHVRGRRMFYEFNLSLFAEIFAIVDPLSFLFHWFFFPSMWDRARGTGNGTGSRLDDRWFSADIRVFCSSA